MTFTFKLQRLDGTHAVPPSIESSVLSWRPGNTIPLGRRSLQVVRAASSAARRCRGSGVAGSARQADGASAAVVAIFRSCSTISVSSTITNPRSCSASVVTDKSIDAHEARPSVGGRATPAAAPLRTQPELGL
jgi:hypothetical protein